MKCRHSVYGMGSNHRQICHTNLSVTHNRHTGNSIPVTGIARPKIGRKSTVDFLNDHMDSGKLKCKQILVPGFKSLRHYRMIGIAYRLGNNAPRIIPRIRVGINKNSHKLRNNKRGMSVINMNSYLFSKIIKRTVGCKVVVDYTLKRSTYKEILLTETQQLTFGMIVSRIKNLGNNICIIVFLKRFNILALREQIHIKAVSIVCLPKSEDVYSGRVSA